MSAEALIAEHMRNVFGAMKDAKGKPYDPLAKTLELAGIHGIEEKRVYRIIKQTTIECGLVPLEFKHLEG